ncbi:MAG TPA: ribonuclease HI family protein [Syntrophorhabdus sp.]|nr:ribonuclease HI family protein [Syntrophorhabdus sp.]HQP57192.1 ribonuclease HI family protein [Syntrophorhabdus sp.]
MEWHIYIDGASSCNPGHAGAGLVIFDEFGKEIGRDSAYLGEMTNNMAEYEALVRALSRAFEANIKSVSIYTDSLLVANQILGKYKIKNTTLQKYAEIAKNLIHTFDHFAVQYIPREKNKIADKLAKEAIKRKG